MELIEINKEDINNDRTNNDTKISMMVTHIMIIGDIDMIKVLPLLPLRYIKSNKYSFRSKIKLPDVQTPGEIIYAGYHGIKRGFIRSKKNNFENAISIDIAADKFVNLKMSHKTIQCTGAKTKQTCIDAVEYLFKHIKYIQRILDRTKYSQEITQNTIEWLTKETKGIDHYIITGTSIIVDNANIQKYDETIYKYIQMSSDRPKIGRMVNYNIKHKIEWICQSINKYKNNCDNITSEIFNNFYKAIFYVYNMIINTSLLPTLETNEFNISYVSNPHMIDKASNYYYYIYQLINYYRLDVHKKDKYTKNYITYIYQDKMYTVYDEKYVDIFINLYDLLKTTGENPIYLDVEQSSSIIYPTTNVLYNYNEDGYSNIDTDKYIDKYLAEYLLRLIPDYTHYDLFIKQINWFISLDKLYQGELSIVNIKYSNINFNYNLGNQIYLNDFKREFSKAAEFKVNRNKQSQKYVSIKLPFTIPDHLKDYIQKDTKSKKWEHTFTVYAKGSVTQSGPHYEMNLEAYHKFMAVYNKIKCNVIKDIL